MTERFMVNRDQSATTPLIQWEFQRDDRHLMCGVHVSQTEPSYEVAMLPLWNGGPVAVWSVGYGGGVEAYLWPVGLVQCDVPVC